MKPQKPNGKMVQMAGGNAQRRTKPVPKNGRPSPKRTTKNTKTKRKAPIRMPLTPEAQRLRQKQIRGKMRRRRQRRRILMLVSALALIVVGIVFCCKLLFQVNGVRIEIGEEKFHYVLPHAELSASSSESSASESTPPNEENSSADSSTETEPPPPENVAPVEESVESEPAEPSPPPAAEAMLREGEQPPEGAEENTEPTQPSESPQPSNSPEIMRQGAKEVPLTQPIADTTYTVGSIVELLQVQAGENLLNVDLKGLSKKIEQQCPYLEHVKVSYKLPNTILVIADIAQPKYYVKVEQGYAILSSNKKVLEIVEQQPQEQIFLKLGKITAEAGLDLRFEPDPQPIDESAILGQTNLSEEEKVKKLKQAKEESALKAQENAQAREANLNLMLQLFDKWGLAEKVTEINVSDDMELEFSYEHRVVTKLGTENQLDYKIQFAKEILTQQLSASDKGELDVSYIREDGELRPVFSRSILN